MSLLSKILYNDKYNRNAVIERESQATAEDFNDIKTIVNALTDDLNWIKSDEFSVNAGTTTINYNNAFPDGVAYAVVVLACYNGQGYAVAHKTTNPTRNGFDLTVGQACVGIYLAIRKR